MRIIGQGLLNKIAQAGHIMLGVIENIREEPTTNEIVMDVRLDSGQVVVLPFRSNARVGMRVVVGPNDFFILT